MTSHIWTIEDVRYLRESPSAPLIKRNDASLAVFSYTRARVYLASRIFYYGTLLSFFYDAPGGFVRIFFRGAGGNEHEMRDDDRKRHRICRDSVAGSRIAPPIVSRLGAASLRHRRVSGLRTLVLIRTRLCLFAPPCKARPSPLARLPLASFSRPRLASASMSSAT